MNLKLASFRKTSWLKNYALREVIVIASLTALISYIQIFLRVGTVDLVANLFRECKSYVVIFFYRLKLGSEVDGDFHGLCS